MGNPIDEALVLKKSGQPERALEVLRNALAKDPKNPRLNCHAAWICDFMGKESEAVTFYETAVANGIQGEDRKDTLLGLGSTYRCLGEFEKSLQIFDQALSEFPKFTVLRTFRCLTLHSLGRHKESFGDLMLQLLETTSNDDIKSYHRALDFYARNL